ncbi:MAG: ATP-binding protein [Actinobacteria bacterium]|nr:ATP-binding protein [Actinomycetota bacterium]
MHETRQPAISPAGSALLAASLGYGLRTPLHSLLGFVELLAISGLDGEQRRMLDDVADGADALYAACDRLLCLVRVLAGHTSGPPELIAPAQLLGEVAATSAAEGSVTLRVSNLPAFLEGDGAAVRQIARELVRNAAEHGSRPIAVAADVVTADGVTADGTETAVLRLRVTDAGPGLPAAVVTRVRQPAEALPTGSTGLGLFLVRGLVANIGGSVDIGTPHRGMAAIKQNRPRPSGLRGARSRI